MGIFSKDKRAVDDRSGESREAGESPHPLIMIATLIAQTPDPLTTVAMVLTLLLRHGALTVEELATLGLSGDELTGMLQAVDDFEDTEAFTYELQVKAAMREYERVLELIAAERGIPRDSDAFVALRSKVAEFAAKNDINDLRVAYRLMLAERPNDLPKHPE